MSHSPLKMFRDYQNKHVLVIGQGPVDTIARSLGFSKVKIELLKVIFVKNGDLFPTILKTAFDFTKCSKHFYHL